MKTLRQVSLDNWSVACPPTIAQINTGSFQRLADAADLVAQSHQKLITAAERAEASAKYWRTESAKQDRQLSALRGHITRLKNQLQQKEPKP